MDCESFKFKLPAAIQVSGPSNVGKSIFVLKLLLNAEQLIEPVPELIFYCYSIWQPNIFNLLQEKYGERIYFIHGFSELEKISFSSEVAHCIVLDDLMYEVGSSEFAANLFTKIAHHGNILLIFITQNIYFKAKYMPTINRNIKYNVVFRNKRFRHELELLARQSLGIGAKNINRIMEIVASENNYPYLIFDLQNSTPEEKSLVTNIFPDSSYPQTYFYID